MPPIIALALCVVLVAVLLRIECKGNPQASLALWIPTVWMLIIGSRPVGRWFESMGATDEAGSPLDRLVLSLLILLAIGILVRRRVAWNQLLKDNTWLIILYLYLAFSILWSDVPFVSLKRWIRLSGFIPVALVILTERSPFEALESVFRRYAYILIPFSLVLTKYFKDLGVDYNSYSGQLMWVGVSGQKNGLGMLCALSIFFLIWAACNNWTSGRLAKLRSQTYADMLMIGIALLLLRGPGGGFSATSIAALTIGLGTMLLLYRKKNVAKWTAVHIKAILIALPVLYLVLGGILLPFVMGLAGRNETLTGRTDIWNMTLDIASRHRFLGVGYGAFWGLESDISSAFGVKQAHNGYLGVYLELGIVGILALLAFLMEFCGKVRREIKHSFDWGIFGMCFLLMILLWNYSEDTFLKTSFLWSNMIIVSLVFSSHALHNED